MSLVLVRLPERSLTVSLLRRGFSVWLVARLMVMALAGVLRDRYWWQLSSGTAFALVATVGALCWLESRRQNEHRFFANLGISPLTTVVLGTAPALAAELVLALAGVR